MSSSPAAIYERDLPVSLERIWENVLDWEHLPHLHAQAFTSISLVASNADGWRAEIGLPGMPGKGAEIDVRLDRPNLRYTSRTVAGTGEGTSIVTHLTPRGADTTSIRVEFDLPWAPADAQATIGDIYRTLYVELWNQDEAMMRERQRVLDAASNPSGDRAAAVSLGSMRDLARRLPLDVELAGRRFRVMAADGRVIAFDTRCPHLGGPLACSAGTEAACPWHGYRYDVATGRSTDGRGLRLAKSAVVDVSACDGEVTLRLP
jgi:nitrite reductase/ring-hydroxylating ferredoxin subunit